MLPRIAMVSTYPPTQCGIATFAHALTDAIVSAGGHVGVLSLGDADGVRHVHRGQRDLMATSQVMSEYDVVVVQHEFGIYDGPDGEEVLAIVAEARPPVITVMHTVPAAPSARQRRILQTLLDVSDAAVVLSHAADRAIRRDYSVRPGSMRVIPHGAPDLGRLRARALDAADGHPRLLTWGLLSRGKGVEWGIRALALLGDLEPAPEYVIAGCTHPKVRAHEGEQYREGLHELAEGLGVMDRIRFVDDYMTTERLAELIASSSAYLLPYESREQITSGVLVEAMVAGGPVIATRFPHAIELLGNGTGYLVDHDDPVAIAEAFRTIIEHPLDAERKRSLAAALSQGFLWPNVGEAYLQLATELWRGRARTSRLSDVLYAEPAGLLRAI